MHFNSQNVNWLPIYQTLSAEELGKDFRLFIACRIVILTRLVEEVLFIVVMMNRWPYFVCHSKKHRFSNFDFLTFTACLSYVKNRGKVFLITSGTKTKRNSRWLSKNREQSPAVVNQLRLVN